MHNAAHLIERARERYGLELDAADLRAILADCRNGAPMLSRHDMGGGEIRLVMVRGVAIKVVWYPDTGRIATILPRGSHALTGTRAGPMKVDEGGREHGAAKQRRLGRKGW